MAVYQFDTGGIPTCGKTAGAFYRVEIAYQTITDAAWDGGLTAPDWTTGLVVRSWPFTFSDLQIEGAPDAGQQSIGDISFEAHNRLLTDGAGAITSDTISSILDVDKSTTAIHVRIGWKATSGGTFVWKFWGVVQWDSLEILYGYMDVAASWIYKFMASDSIMQLDTRTFTQFSEDKFLAASYYYAATTPYVTFIGTVTGTPVLIPAGRHAITSVAYYAQQADGSRKRYQFNATTMRYVRLKELVQAFSDYLGLGTNVNGGTLGTLVGNTYGINTATPTGTTMQWVGLDSLYISAGLFETFYRAEGSFFDYTTDCAWSFHRMASALDVLKKVVQSLGLVMRVTIDGSGNRQLSVVPMTASVSALSPATSAVLSDATLKPYRRALSGAHITVPSGSPVIRGANGSKTVNIDCIFSSCNNARRSETLATHGTLDLGPDRLTALWASADTPSGLTVATMHSVCAIALYVGTSPAPSTSLIDPWGKYQTAAPFALNTVMYPNEAEPYNDWVEVPAMALAHLLFSDRIGTDDISLYRDKGQELEIEVRGITGTIYYPGDQVTVTIGGSAIVWTVKSYGENHKDNTMQFTLERFA